MDADFPIDFPSVPPPLPVSFPSASEPGSPASFGNHVSQSTAHSAGGSWRENPSLHFAGPSLSPEVFHCLVCSWRPASDHCQFKTALGLHLEGIPSFFFPSPLLFFFFLIIKASSLVAILVVNPFSFCAFSFPLQPPSPLPFWQTIFERLLNEISVHQLPPWFCSLVLRE